MNKRKTVTRCIDILLVLVNIFFFIGLGTFASACGIKEDGGWMTCHWAAQSLSGICAVLLTDSVLNLIFRDPWLKTGIMAAMIPLSVLCAILPGSLIELCMMNTMHCHTVMRPFAILMSTANIILTLTGIIASRSHRSLKT